MADLDTREWLLTNGLGSFASGTVSDIRTRSYHGWLFAATNPPSGRTLLLSHLEASLELSDRVVALGTNFWGSCQIEPKGYELLRLFDINPVPKWIWGEDDWQLTRHLVMPYGLVRQRGLGGFQRQIPNEGNPPMALRATLRACCTGSPIPLYPLPKPLISRFHA